MAPRQGRQTTPEDFPVQSPPPSGDYSYTLEIVMQMQVTMGKLLEAVETLKSDSREHRNELKTIGQDIHGAKVALRWVIGVCVALSGAIGWVAKAYLDQLARSESLPAKQIADLQKAIKDAEKSHLSESKVAKLKALTPSLEASVSSAKSPADVARVQALVEILKHPAA